MAVALNPITFEYSIKLVIEFIICSFFGSEWIRMIHSKWCVIPTAHNRTKWDVSHYFPSKWRWIDIETHTHTHTAKMIIIVVTIIICRLLIGNRSKGFIADFQSLNRNASLTHFILFCVLNLRSYKWLGNSIIILDASWIIANSMLC